MRSYSPFPSYQLVIPDATQGRHEGDLISLWQDDCDIALQMSSKLRFAGEQVSASQRLNEAIVRENMKDVVREQIDIIACPDVAAATMTDADNAFLWTYCYAVWPDLAVFCTISGASATFQERRGWAIEAIRSISRI